MSRQIEVVLTGCHPEPLGSYLKALGVLRLVAEQHDPGARGFWRGDNFVLQSSLDRDALRVFFAQRYVPSPIVVPWGGAGGFYYEEGKSAEKDEAGKKIKTGVRDVETEATRMLAAVAGSHAARLAPLRAAIDICRATLSAMALTEAPTEELKQQLIARLRSTLPDMAVAWMDASVFMTTEKLSFPPLLGTGGNDGKLNFGKQLLGILADLFDLETGHATAHCLPWLDASLFEAPVPGLESLSSAQFDPGGWTGATNGGVGFYGKPSVSPWDFVLLLEGTLIFAAAATRRSESLGPSMFAVPFTVRPRGVGFPTASATEDGSRAEMWLPLWTTPTGLAEIRALFGEGRARIGTRSAETATDFARAVAGLGIDRGLNAFARYGFQLRNGRMYLASPLGRWRVRPNPDVDLLDGPLDIWLERFHRMATGAQAPAALERSARAIDRAIMALCREASPTTVLGVLTALGEVDAALSRSLSHVLGQKYVLAPVPFLDPKWLDAARKDSAELRLAMSLAAQGYRERLVHVRAPKRYPEWQKQDDGRTTWRAADLERSLVATLRREEIEWGRGDPRTAPRVFAALPDIARFVAGQTDDAALESWLRGLSLVDWSAVTPAQLAPDVQGPLPPATWALFTLARGRIAQNGTSLPRTPGLLARTAAGDARGATRLAARRLKGAGLALAFDALDEPPRRLQRILAALAFPVAPSDLASLVHLLAPHRPDETQSHQPVSMESTV